MASNTTDSLGLDLRVRHWSFIEPAPGLQTVARRRGPDTRSDRPVPCKLLKNLGRNLTLLRIILWLFTMDRFRDAVHQAAATEGVGGSSEQVQEAVKAANRATRYNNQLA